MKVNVLFVCLGNICRSPMAKSLFDYKIRSYGLVDSIICDSCGTADYHLSKNADPRTIKILQKKSVPIFHRARQLNKEDFSKFSYIIAMDENNYHDILYNKPSQSTSRIMMMRHYDKSADSINVPDPYYGDDHEFIEVFDILDRSTEKLLNTIIKEYEISPTRS